MVPPGLLLYLWLVWEMALLPTLEPSGLTFFHAVVSSAITFPYAGSRQNVKLEDMAGECTRCLHLLLRIWRSGLGQGCVSE